LIQTVVYTDFTEVLKEVAIRPGQVRSAVELIDGVATPRNGSSTGHGGKELAQELAQKNPSFSSAQEAPTERKFKRPSGSVRNRTGVHHPPAISSPSPFRAKPRSDTKTRDQQGYLTKNKRVQSG
jgi:hypothetical protein